MRRIVKYLKNRTKIIIAFILGIIISGGGVYAATVIAASSVGYSDKASLGATNVQDAIDKLNTKATTKIKEAEAKCPDGYKCIKPLCKRAKMLHTETCTWTTTSYYCSADGYTSTGSMKTTTITYGNLGTTGTLTSGDAFDCDVNGDGVYDSATERFYYVSDMTNGVIKSSNIAVLIYYNNVSGGVASNITKYAYDESRKNNNGPVTAIKQLPTIAQWKNTSLINVTRAITNENGGNTVSLGGTIENLSTAFSYEGYAARLLTAQEVSAGCGFTVGSMTVGQLGAKCRYLMENTVYSSSKIKAYGEWLESPKASTYSEDDGNVWHVESRYRRIYYSYANIRGGESPGVRPAIEVLKSNISY